jgi:choline dehydrogenase-like flavoprotein
VSTNEQHDVVIAGAGIAGALMAKFLTRAGLKVLVLEAGPESAKSFEGYQEHLRHFYAASGKGPESAWPPDAHAPQPDTADLKQNNGYFIQSGPDRYGSSYSRTRGGSTLHWLGVSLRMLPEDFQLRSLYGVGRDWPLRYSDLEPYYCKAEYEMGVSADVAEQRYHGLTFTEGYDYPMRRVPPSYSDRKLAEAVDGMDVDLGDGPVPLKIRTYPAARNSTPRPGYAPVGAIDERAGSRAVEMFVGQRCQGNTSCTPICPVQAKYNAGKTMAQADRSKLQVLSQAVVSKVNVDPATGQVQSLTYLRYDASGFTIHQASARAYVLAAHAVENAKLMLISGLTGPKDLVGKTLMDHPALYAWGLAPEPVGAYRGPLSTAGLEDLRAGPFRARHAAFRFDIGNDGWRAATGAPDTAVAAAVTKQNLYGRKLRDQLASTLSRQVRFSLAVEQLPDPANCVTIDPGHPDPLGLPRPVISYHIDDYTKAGMAAATKVYKQVFQRAGITDCTNPNEGHWFPTVIWGDVVFPYHGMGHFAGTHVMGASRHDSVVDSHQRSWDHRNLYLVGSGSFPTMGTANPTLTLAALTIRTAEHLIASLKP